MPSNDQEEAHCRDDGCVIYVGLWIGVFVVHWLAAAAHGVRVARHLRSKLLSPQRSRFHVITVILTLIYCGSHVLSFSLRLYREEKAKDTSEAELFVLVPLIDFTLATTALHALYSITLYLWWQVMARMMPLGRKALIDRRIITYNVVQVVSIVGVAVAQHFVIPNEHERAIFDGIINIAIAIINLVLVVGFMVMIRHFRALYRRMRSALGPKRRTLFGASRGSSRADPLLAGAADVPEDVSRRRGSGGGGGGDGGDTGSESTASSWASGAGGDAVADRALRPLLVFMGVSLMTAVGSVVTSAVLIVDGVWLFTKLRYPGLSDSTPQFSFVYTNPLWVLHVYRVGEWLPAASLLAALVRMYRPDQVYVSRLAGGAAGGGVGDGAPWDGQGREPELLPGEDGPGVDTLLSRGDASSMGSLSLLNAFPSQRRSGTGVEHARGLSGGAFRPGVVDIAGAVATHEFDVGVGQWVSAWSVSGSQSGVASTPGYGRGSGSGSVPRGSHESLILESLPSRETQMTPLIRERTATE